MARLVPTGLFIAISSLSGAALAGEPSDHPWLIGQTISTARNFSLPPGQGQVRRDGSGSRIIAGKRFMPNGVMGVGFFGQKSESSPLSPATARELSMPKQRKAAVGISLRF